MGRGWDVLQSAVLHEPVNAGAGDGADHELSSWDGRTDGQTAAVSAACCAGGCRCACSAVPRHGWRWGCGVLSKAKQSGIGAAARRALLLEVSAGLRAETAAQPAGWGWTQAAESVCGICSFLFGLVCLFFFSSRCL